MKCSYDRENIVILKYATKPFNVLLACTRPLITELANNPQSVIGKLVPFALRQFMCYGHIGGYGLLLFDFLYGKISNDDSLPYSMLMIPDI